MQNCRYPGLSPSAGAGAPAGRALQAVPERRVQLEHLEQELEAWYENTGGKPIWVTEFACNPWAERSCNASLHSRLMDQVVPVLEAALRVLARAEPRDLPVVRGVVIPRRPARASRRRTRERSGRSAGRRQLARSTAASGRPSGHPEAVGHDDAPHPHVRGRSQRVAW